MCVSVKLGRSMFPWATAETVQREGTGAHPGNVTELAAGRRDISFLVGQ